jgi:hypothetical protein
LAAHAAGERGIPFIPIFSFCFVPLPSLFPSFHPPQASNPTATIAAAFPPIVLLQTNAIQFPIGPRVTK